MRSSFLNLKSCHHSEKFGHFWVTPVTESQHVRSQGPGFNQNNLSKYISHTWWLIPVSKWVITTVINGISRVNPLITVCYNPLTKWDEPPSSEMLIGF